MRFEVPDAPPVPDGLINVVADGAGAGRTNTLTSGYSL